MIKKTQRISNKHDEKTQRALSHFLRIFAIEYNGNIVEEYDLTVKDNCLINIIIV